MRTKQDPPIVAKQKNRKKNLCMSFFCSTFAAEMCTYVYACAVCASN